MASRPVALEGLDRGLADDLRRAGLDATNLDLLPAGDGWLLVEFGGDTAEQAAERADAFSRRTAASATPPAIRTFDTPEDQEYDQVDCTHHAYN